MEGADLEQFRRDAADLEPGEPALAIYSEIWERSPSDVRAANMLGRSLEGLGRIDEAKEHWELVAELQPDNDIARRRARQLRHRSTKVAAAGGGEAMTDPAEIRAYYEATTDRMRQVLDELARHPGERRTNPQVEAALGWEPLSVRGTAAASTRRVGKEAFGGQLPYHSRQAATSQSGRFEIWMDASQAAAIRSNN
ncbi:MAG TPA: hypothetical protein VLA19_05555 [Herpetosiphonaceae bacterium]|nr:hypothetical protein [Herpetosiphonaceae bacterium]